MVDIAEAIKSKFAGIATVQVSSSDNDFNTMISQVQNFATMKANTLYIMPQNPKAMVEALREARKSGVKIAVAGVSFDEDSADAYDRVINVNQYLVGAYAAYMAKVWLDETHPNAVANSIETAILINDESEDALARTKGLYSIAEPYLKNAQGEFIDTEGNVVAESGKMTNPAYAPSVKVIGQYVGFNFQDGRVSTENFLTSNPNLKLVLTYSSAMASGAAQVFADRGLSTSQLAGIGVFSGDFAGNELPLIKDASLGKGVYRGTVAFGSEDLPAYLANVVMELFNDTYEEKILWDPISMVSARNGEEFRTVVKNTGALTPPAN
jgi:ABC-type sugar transport system substrate-binding protein